MTTIQFLRQTADHRLFLLEVFAVFLWVCCSLLTYALTNTPYLHSLHSSLESFPPFQLFLSLLVVMMGIWEVFNLSLGSHFNPVVTVALSLNGQLSAKYASVLILAQFLGHILAVITARNIFAILFPSYIAGVFAPPAPHEEVSYFLAVAIEAIITALVCGLAMSLNDLFGEKQSIKKWSVMTGTIVVVLAVAGEWTGSCMNPALCFSLALLERSWDKHGVYWVGPLLGAVMSGVGYNFVNRRRMRGGREEGEEGEREKED